MLPSLDAPKTGPEEDQSLRCWRGWRCCLLFLVRALLQLACLGHVLPSPLVRSAKPILQRRSTFRHVAGACTQRDVRARDEDMLGILQGLYWTLLDFIGLYWTLLDFIGLYCKVIHVSSTLTTHIALTKVVNEHLPLDKWMGLKNIVEHVVWTLHPSSWP